MEARAALAITWPAQRLPRPLEDTSITNEDFGESVCMTFRDLERAGKDCTDVQFLCYGSI